MWMLCLGIALLVMAAVLAVCALARKPSAARPVGPTSQELIDHHSKGRGTPL